MRCAETLPPPTLEQGLLAALTFAAVFAFAGWAVRPVLRDARYPRWLSVVIVVAVPPVVGIMLREMISYAEYRAGLRESGWVIAWVSIELIVYCGVVLYGGILPLPQVVMPNVPQSPATPPVEETHGRPIDRSDRPARQ